MEVVKVTRFRSGPIVNQHPSPPGQRINESYQNPLLPRSISIRRSLVEELAQVIRGMNREVEIEYC